MKNKGKINPYALRELLEHELQNKPNMTLKEFLDKLNEAVKERDMFNFWKDGISSHDIDSGRITKRELNIYYRDKFPKGRIIDIILTKIQRG